MSSESERGTNRTGLKSSGLSLSHSDIEDALSRSPDDGATLDLTNRNLTDVGELGAEQLATIGRKDVIEDECSLFRIALGNNRLATLPMAFALLSRLRYLNLKSNSFSQFPDVLTVMPSLEILDISRNKIKRLPSQPGYLVNLQVFCFSRNKLTRLPPYLSKFQHLSILKADHNPIEWPPRHVMEYAGGLENPQHMKDWISRVQNWIEDNTLNTKHEESQDIDSAIGESFASWSRFGAGINPHTRSFSTDSNMSMYSVPESVEELLESPGAGPSRPSPLRTNGFPSFTPSPSRSPDSYLPSPIDSVGSKDERADAVSSLGSGSTLSAQQQHARNASYAGSALSSTKRPPLLVKKSLPDLRTIKLNKTPPDLPTTTAKEFSIPSPLSQRQDSTESAFRPFTHEPTASPTTHSTPPSMDATRTSYFRRMSAIPASATRKTLPLPLVHLVESARSILFAVMQLHQTLEHYTVYTFEERLSSVLRKVLDPALADIMHLVDALDRFDAMSLKSLPTPSACRSVVERCKDTVSVFGKAIGVLSLQLKILATRDDVRYLRQMLLVLYGAMAEISHAWHGMAPHIEVVKGLLRDQRRPSNTSLFSPIGRSPVVGEPPGTPSFLTKQTTTLRKASGGTITVARTRTLRRHAGSFSSKDVEIGKKLPSYDEAPESPAIMQTPTIRAMQRKMSSPTISFSPSPSRQGHNAWESHSRQGSQSSQLASSSSSTSSPSIKDTGASNSTMVVDQEALESMKEAAEAAPAVWELLDEVLSDEVDSVDVRVNLARAKSLTIQLRDQIRLHQHDDPTADRLALREDARLFALTVIDLATFIKHNKHHLLSSSSSRTKMIRLIKPTEELLILFHVSSYSPSSAPRPFSPLTSGMASPMIAPEDNRLVASLSRSRSAQPSPVPKPLKLVASASASASSPRSASYFKVPPRMASVLNRTGSFEAG